jgi:hypothetical protein
MQLTRTDENGTSFVEGVPGELFLSQAQDITRLIEVCFSERVRAALLYAANLPPAFFDLSSGQAGEVLQKLRNYHIRLAVVYDPTRVALSSRFSELMTDERRGSDFGLFDSRQAACGWLQQGV